MSAFGQQNGIIKFNNQPSQDHSPMKSMQDQVKHGEYGNNGSCVRSTKHFVEKGSPQLDRVSLGRALVYSGNDIPSIYEKTPLIMKPNLEKMGI